MCSRDVDGRTVNKASAATKCLICVICDPFVDIYHLERERLKFYIFFLSLQFLEMRLSKAYDEEEHNSTGVALHRGRAFGAKCGAV